MATKKFRVVTATGGAIAQNGMVRVRVSFSEPGNSKLRISHKSCPTLEVPYPNGVLEVDDPVSQEIIAAMIVPQNTTRDGQKRPAGKLFVEVPATTATSLKLETELTARYKSKYKQQQL